MVFFDSNSVLINHSGMQILDAVVANVKSGRGKTTVRGHADTGETAPPAVARARSEAIGRVAPRKGSLQYCQAGNDRLTLSTSVRRRARLS